MNIVTEKICFKLRKTAQEFGETALSNAVIIGSWNTHYPVPEDIGGVRFIECPTIGNTALGQVEYKVARYFEDINDEVVEVP